MTEDAFLVSLNKVSEVSHFLFQLCYNHKAKLLLKLLSFIMIAWVCTDGEILSWPYIPAVTWLAMLSTLHTSIALVTTGMHQKRIVQIIDIIYDQTPYVSILPSRSHKHGTQGIY